MRRAVGLALPWLLLACERAPRSSPPLQPPVDAPTPRDVPSARPDVPAVADVATADAPAVTPTPPAHVDVNATSVDRLVSLPDGVVLLRAMNREGQRTSEIIAIRLDAQGLAVGVPRLLRRTSGPVVTLDGSFAEGGLWVAWGSVRPVAEGRGDHLVAALRVRADLTAVERPITLQDFRAIVGDGDMAPQVINRLEVGILAVEGGGAVVVSSSPVTRCDHGEGDHVERTPCRGWTVARIAADGRVGREVDAAIAHTAGPSSLVALPGGFAFAVSNDHIGSKTVIDVRPVDPAGRAPFAGDECWHYRDVRLARLGASLLAQGTPTEGDMAPSAIGHARVFGPQAALTRLRRDAHGSPEWPAVTSRALRCQGGRPVVQLRWAGGGATLDPVRDGASLDWSQWVARTELPGLEGTAPTPPLAWTGQVLVAWDAGGWNRYRCGPRGVLTPAP
jgi:hypothetical protein